MCFHQRIQSLFNHIRSHPASLPRLRKEITFLWNVVSVLGEEEKTLMKLKLVKGFHFSPSSTLVSNEMFAEIVELFLLKTVIEYLSFFNFFI